MGAPNTSSSEEVHPGGVVPPELIRSHLDKVVESRPFLRSERMKRFLRFAVEEVLAGRGRELKEHTIAVNVFDKPVDFDPHFDPIVRVEAGRLRAKLREYYEAEGSRDAVRITIQKRGYTPEFTWNTSAARIAAQALPALPAQQTAAARPPLNAMAVLPFVDVSPGGDQAHLCNGITEALLNTLSRVENLRVISRTSAMLYKGAAADVREIGARLNAGSVLEGSVGRFGTRLRVTAQLVSVADGYQLWSEIYDRDVTDTFEAQRDISMCIATALQLHLLESAAAPSPAAPSSGSGAVERFLEGRYWWNRRKADDLLRAVACFEQAVARAPGYALAYAGLAQARALLGWRCIEPAAEHWKTAAEMAERALEQDRTIGGAWAALAFVEAAYKWNWEEAERLFERGIEAEPADATVRHWYAMYCLAPQCRLDQALHHMRRAGELDPLSAIIAAHTGRIHYFRREYDLALSQFDKALRLDPALHLAHLYIGMAEEQRCHFDAALAAYEAGAALDGRDPSTTALIARCTARAHGTEAAEALLAEIAVPERRVRISPADLATVALALGDCEGALAHLTRACDARCARIINVRVDPAYDQLKPDARLAAILRRVGLNR